MYYVAAEKMLFLALGLVVLLSLCWFIIKQRSNKHLEKKVALQKQHIREIVSQAMGQRAFFEIMQPYPVGRHVLTALCQHMDNEKILFEVVRGTLSEEVLHAELQVFFQVKFDKREFYNFRATAEKFFRNAHGSYLIFPFPPCLENSQRRNFARVHIEAGMLGKTTLYRERELSQEQHTGILQDWLPIPPGFVIKDISAGGVGLIMEKEQLLRSKVLPGQSMLLSLVLLDSEKNVSLLVQGRVVRVDQSMHANYVQVGLIFERWIQKMHIRTMGTWQKIQKESGVPLILPWVTRKLMVLPRSYNAPTSLKDKVQHKMPLVLDAKSLFLPSVYVPQNWKTKIQRQED